jgi:hypothetical protein
MARKHAECAHVATLMAQQHATFNFGHFSFHMHIWSDAPGHDDVDVAYTPGAALMERVAHQLRVDFVSQVVASESGH